MKIAFFGHNASDATIRKRIRSMKSAGHDVTGFMMDRLEDNVPEWDNIALGTTRNGDFVQRFLSVFKGARKAAKHPEKLKSADLVYARNLDMLGTAFLAKRLLKLDTPVIYESLDIHRLLCRPDIIGKTLRVIEHKLLKRCLGVVVSSPAFIENHFDKHYRGDFKHFLYENRLPPEFNNVDRKQFVKSPSETSPSPLKIGWVGILRCQRTLEILSKSAELLGNNIEVIIYGKPALDSVPDFHDTIAAHPNMHFHGAYKSPDDLEKIYASMDIVWSGDFMEAGLNSVWLLPNRIYEGGFYVTPAITPAGTQTAKWIEERQSGFTIAEPLETQVPEKLRELHLNRSLIAEKERTLLSLPKTSFVESDAFFQEVIENLMPQ